MPIVSEIIGNILIIRAGDNEEAIYKFASTQLSKNKTIKTVLMQTEKVSKQERVPSLQYLMGEKNFETFHKEYGCTFYLNPAKVFFSPRLKFERQRIANEVKENEKIINFFSGVGPFSICIAKKKPSTIVQSIEINPVAYEYMLKNIDVNKCKNNVIPHLGDALQIVKESFFDYADRVILPLPMLAEQSLPLAIRSLSNGSGIIHWQISDYVGNKGVGGTVYDIAKKRLDGMLKEHKIENNLIIRFARIIRPLSPNIAHIAVDIAVH